MGDDKGLSEQRLAEIEARVSAASAGPWMQAHHIDEPRAIVPRSRPNHSLLAVDRDGMAIFDRAEDAAFTVAAREDIPALVAEVRRLRAEAAS